jgi:hypothetical protein
MISDKSGWLIIRDSFEVKAAVCDTSAHANALK